MDLSKLVDWIKLSPRYLLPICIFTGFLVFAPARTLAIFGLGHVVSDYRGWLGFAFLLSATLLVSSALVGGYRWFQDRRRASQQLKDLRRRLHNLSEPEKEVLRGFMDNQTKTQYLSMADGIVNGLVAEGILFRSSTVATDLHHWAYNIQPWAWDYLNSHRKLLK